MLFNNQVYGMEALHVGENALC